MRGRRACQARFFSGKRLAASSTLLAASSTLLPLLLAATSLHAQADWPVYRHDARHTAVTPARGRITRPEILWEHYLGVPYQKIATDRPGADPRVVDLDGDGTAERFEISGRTIRVTDLSGKLLWSHEADGELGGKVRVCRLFPERPGEQILVFLNRMDTGEGHGRAFAFHDGVRKGALAWSTGPLTGYHAPTIVVDDVDGDDRPDVVVAPHYRVQIFDGQTGQLKGEAPWQVGRNYGLLTTRPRRDGPGKDIYIVCDFVLHVDRIARIDGEWKHAWGNKYFDPNSPLPEGRQNYIRVGPDAVRDIDGDGLDEMVYMLVDAAADDSWHLRVRDAASGAVEADISGIWLWSILDMDGDGVGELIYSRTTAKRPRTFTDLRVARLRDSKLIDLGVVEGVRPALANATLAPHIDTIADEGLQDLLRADLSGTGRPGVFVGRRGGETTFEDEILAVGLDGEGALKTVWSFRRSGHRLNVVHAGPVRDGAADPRDLVVRVRDLTAQEELELDASGKVVATRKLGRDGGISTTPIVVDVDGARPNEIIIQNASREVVALRAGARKDDPPEIVWSVPGVAMARQPGYTWNGELSVQAADLTGDGKMDVVFAAEDAEGLASVVALGGDGKRRWQRSIPGCAWGGLQAGVDQWTFGRFAGRSGDGTRGLDVYVDLHRRSKGSGEGWVLRGDTGEVVWSRKGLVAGAQAMPFGGSNPSVADVDGDGRDDLVQLNFTIYGVTSGATGDPVFPPAFLWDEKYFGRWVAYSSPTVLDLDGDGKPEAYLNSASYARGAYAAVRIAGEPLWAEFHDNTEGSDGFGPVGDFDGDGRLEIGVPVLNGTLVCLNAADGSRRWTVDTPVSGDVVAGDVNGDGILELVFSGRDGRLHAVSGKDGRELWSIAATGRPVIADVTGDGLVEVLAVGGDGVLRVVGQRG